MKTPLIYLALMSILLIEPGCNNKEVSEKIVYPATQKGTQVDDYFGTKVADPYRWLEDDTAADVKKWVQDENKVTNSYLSKIPFRDAIKKHLTDIWNYERYSSPFRAGEYYFFSKNDGLQNQSVIYFQKGLDGEPKVFMDPNKMSADGTANVSLISFSKDKKYVAYSVQQSGSDWNSLYVMEVASQKKLEDKLEGVKFGGASWKGNCFYYSRYEKASGGKEFSQKNEFHKVYFHVIGNPQEKDELIYEDKEHPQRYHTAQVTEDERFLVIYVSQGTYGSELLYRDLSKNEPLKPLVKGFDHQYSVLDNQGDKLIVQTDNGAPNQCIVLIDPKKPQPENWTGLIAEKPELLEGSSTGGGKIFTTYLKDVTTRIYQYDMNGKLEHEITLPALGTSGGLGGEADDKVLFYSFTSFTYPPAIYKYDIATGKSEVWRKSNVKFNPDDYETKQVFYKSKDSTSIPMFIVSKKGVKLDGNNPTLLYAYGGFNISQQPGFNVSTLMLLENGGVYALANLRGGGEYGDKWHKAGMLLKKQNVFDDFIAATEYLIKEKYTSPEKLAIMGRSNGGLLIGACITQRPELYKVAFPIVELWICFATINLLLAGVGPLNTEEAIALVILKIC
ncbi:MAG: serine protease, family peptidase [Bacteroidota bacterium]|nr:serine protease, family peptidase [Bacteroidota bacterium]